MSATRKAYSLSVIGVAFIRSRRTSSIPTISPAMNAARNGLRVPLMSFSGSPGSLAVSIRMIATGTSGPLLTSATAQNPTLGVSLSQSRIDCSLAWRHSAAQLISGIFLDRFQRLKNRLHAGDLVLGFLLRHPSIGNPTRIDAQPHGDLTLDAGDLLVDAWWDEIHSSAAIGTGGVAPLRMNPPSTPNTLSPSFRIAACT